MGGVGTVKRTEAGGDLSSPGTTRLSGSSRSGTGVGKFELLNMLSRDIFGHYRTGTEPRNSNTLKRMRESDCLERGNGVKAGLS
jgi:hypothetical protein